jgi:hypothetical protein
MQLLRQVGVGVFYSLNFHDLYFCSYVCECVCFQDFATRSLQMSEESLAALQADDDNDNNIQQYQMRRTWESR